MTVGELLMQLVNYPDDMVVVVEHTNVCVSCDTKDKDGFTDFEIVTPGVDFRTGEDLFDKYEASSESVKHDGCSYRKSDTIDFKPKQNCTVSVEKSTHEAVLAIGTSQRFVPHPDIEHRDTPRYLDEVLLIS